MRPTKDLEVVELGEVAGWSEMAIDAAIHRLTQFVALVNDFEIFGAKLAAHDEADFVFAILTILLDVVEHGSETTGDGAEDAAVEESGFTIVAHCAFEGGDVEVGDWVVGVAGVADEPGVGLERAVHGGLGRLRAVCVEVTLCPIGLF